MDYTQVNLFQKKTKYYKNKNKLVVKGYLGRVPTENSFNLIKNLIFRSLLLFCSKSTRASNFLKKFIRKILMFSKNKQIYRLDAVFDLDNLMLDINLFSDNAANPVDIDLGTTISDRYVPQSKFSRMSDFNLKQSLLNKKTKEKILKELKKIIKLVLILNLLNNYFFAINNWFAINADNLNLISNLSIEISNGKPIGENINFLASTTFKFFALASSFSSFIFGI